MVKDVSYHLKKYFCKNKTAALAYNFIKHTLKQPYRNGSSNILQNIDHKLMPQMISSLIAHFIE